MVIALQRLNEAHGLSDGLHFPLQIARPNSFREVIQIIGRSSDGLIHSGRRFGFVVLL